MVLLIVFKLLLNQLTVLLGTVNFAVEQKMRI